MSISITINASDVDDLRRQMIALLGATDAPTVTTPNVTPRSTKAEAPKVDPQPNPTPEPEVNESPADEPQDDTAAPGDSAELTYEGDIKPAVLKVSAKGGRPAVEKLLSQFEAANAKEIPEAKWPELLAEIDKILA